jgi:predicted HicB family RNase H-like nuclease
MTQRRVRGDRHRVKTYVMVRLPAEDKADIQRAAERAGLTVQEWLERAIWRALDAQRA